MLQPGRVYSSAVHGIDDNLRIKLRRAANSNPALRLPTGSVVGTFHQDHRRHWTGITSWNLDVLRIENVDVTVAIGRDGGLPLISDAQADAILRRKSDTYPVCSNR
jgi:hypothetical protein